MTASSARPSLPGVVCMLGATQIVGYGTLYYSFSVLAPSMAPDVGWPVEWVYGLFSLALLAGGCLAPFAGKAFDRFGAGTVMAAGSVLSALALAFSALGSGPVAFAAGIVAIEMASTLVLYEAAFALIVRIAGPEARRVITHLTLIAGFASTLFWPLTAFLAESLSWREVFLVFAGLNLVVCLPLHILLAGLPAAKGAAAADGGEATEAPAALPDLLPMAMRRRALVILVAAFSIGGFVMSAMLVHMVPLLASLGLGSASVLVGSVFGPAQVLSRVSMMAAGARMRPMHLALVSAALIPAAILMLAATAPVVAGALLFATLFGLGAGLTSIVRGIVPLSLFGETGYGARMGWMTSARLVLSAVAPFAFALVLHRFGPLMALSCLCIVGLAGLLCLVEIDRMRRHASRGGAAG